MRHSIYLVMVHDRGTNGHSSRPLSYLYFFKPSIRFFLKHRFTAMVCNINIRRVELHQGIKVIINGAYTFALQRWQNFE
jgi:hypothetical protein